MSDKYSNPKQMMPFPVNTKYDGKQIYKAKPIEMASTQKHTAQMSTLYLQNKEKVLGKINVSEQILKSSTIFAVSSKSNI